MDETPEYRDYAFGEMTLRYLYDPESGHIAMTLIPQGTETYYHERRKYLRHRDLICNAWETGSLCHLALRHHAQGNGAGKRKMIMIPRGAMGTGRAIRRNSPQDCADYPAN